MFGPPSAQFMTTLDFDLRTTRAPPWPGTRSTMIDTLRRRHWSQPIVSSSQPPRMSTALAETRIEAETSRSPFCAEAKTSGSARAAPAKTAAPSTVAAKIVKRLIVPPRPLKPLGRPYRASPAPAAVYRSPHDDHRAHQAGHPVSPGRRQAHRRRLLLPRPDRLAERRPDRAGRPRRVQLRVLRQRLRRPHRSATTACSAPT